MIRRRNRRLALLLATGVLLLLGTSAAGASSSIEGVWSFNGGQIAIHPGAHGTFTGTVVAETKFATCSHPVGEEIWTGMRLQPDGSYHGFHQWYYESETCPPNPILGPTAWRILASGDGSHYLRVCFSSPGSAQPLIAPDGGETDVTYGCVNSGLTAPLASGVLNFKKLVTLPSARKCFSRRAFEIHIRDPENDPFKTITITIRGRKLVVTHRGKFSVAMVKLKGLPRGTFTVKVHAITVLGHVLSGHRTYHTCVRKRAPSKKHHS